MELKEIIENLKNYEGLTRKKGIGKITKALQEVSNFGDTCVGPGDDAAAIKDGDSYLLFSADGIWKRLVESNPYAAGRASVIVNVNDIYAMGGKPIAMVNIISSSNDYDIDSLLKGIKDVCKLYRVPMVGGHFHPDSDSVQLSVSIIGRAKKLLTSHTAKAGQNIIAAIDLDGMRGDNSVYSWNSISNKSTEQILSNLGIITRIAEEGMCDTAKDVSNPGILGTLTMLLHSSCKGADVKLDAIPKPSSINMLDWLKIYPSYGFILCVDKDHSDYCVKLFNDNKIAADVIGEVNDESCLSINFEEKREIFFDFDKDDLY